MSAGGTRLRQLHKISQSTPNAKLKNAAVRGGIANLSAQALNALLRIGAMVVFARLLNPNDFGIVAMVTSIVSALNMFRDFGLSTATIQRTSVTNDQLSALFWINILVGLILMSITLAGASSIAAFYREPRLLWITVALASTFLLNATAIQHSALLRRQMRFTELAFIETISLLTSTLFGVALATLSFGYWALIGMSISNVMIYSILTWMTSGWRPTAPSRRAGIGSMIRLGGIVTANGIIMHIANNLDKVLLGRFWGAESLGMYGRAQTLVSFPNDSLNSAVGLVLLSALSRIKDQSERWKNYFVKGYSLLLAISFPITAICALFAEEIIVTVLGPKWVKAIPLFRYLTPSILIFGMINPIGSLLVSMGLLGRSLRMALVLGPIVIIGFSVGLFWGPVGAAIGLSSALALWAMPHLAWAVYGTPVTMSDILKAIGRPFGASLIAAVFAGCLVHFCLDSMIPSVRLVLGVSLFIFIYALVLLVIMKQWSLFSDVLDTLRGGSSSATDSH
jgi:PST family polysaccharide transporter